MDKTGFHLCAAKWSSAASSFCNPHVEQPDDDLWFFRLNTEDLENEMHVALGSRNKST